MRGPRLAPNLSPWAEGPAQTPLWSFPRLIVELSFLRTAGHFAADDVKAKLNDLNQKWESLKGKASQRRQDLEDSLQAQQYFADANEAESWMREKEPIVGSTDYGKDEDSAEVRPCWKPTVFVRSDVRSWDWAAAGSLNAKLAGWGGQGASAPPMLKRRPSLSRRLGPARTQGPYLLAAKQRWQQGCSKCCLSVSQALLKKHEALMSDLSAYGSSIQALREQAQACRVRKTGRNSLQKCRGRGCRL